MDTDLALVLGLVIFFLAFPAVVTAFSHNRSPRVAALCFVFGGGLIAYAVSQNPNGYTFHDLPQLFAKVVKSYMPS